MQRQNPELTPLEDTRYATLELLAALLPTGDQQKKGMIREDDYLELPHTLNDNQRQSLRHAIFEFKHPGTKVSDQPNPVARALNSISI